MSIVTLERVILKNARILFFNSKLRMKDIQEWSGGEITPHDGEVVLFVPDPGVYVAVKTECDKRSA